MHPLPLSTRPGVDGYAPPMVLPPTRQRLAAGDCGSPQGAASVMPRRRSPRSLEALKVKSSPDFFPSSDGEVGGRGHRASTVPPA